jgi:hypothetical protein
MRIVPFLAVASLAILTSTSAFAASILSSQRISKLDIFPYGSRTFTGFEPYVDSMQGSMVSASQVSSLSPQLVSFSGEVSGGRTSQIGFTMGTSSLDLTFDIDEPTSFTLDASAYGMIIVRLQGPAVDLNSQVTTLATGEFVPGRYRLEVVLVESAGVGDPIGTVHTGSGQMRLMIPEPVLFAWAFLALPMRRRTLTRTSEACSRL